MTVKRCDLCGGRGVDRAVFVARLVGPADAQRAVAEPVLVRSCCGALISDTDYSRAARESQERGEYVPAREGAAPCSPSSR